MKFDLRWQADEDLLAGQIARAYWAGENTADGYAFKDKVASVAERFGTQPWGLNKLVNEGVDLFCQFKCKQCGRELEELMPNASRAAFQERHKRPNIPCAECYTKNREDSEQRVAQEDKERAAAAQAQRAADRTKAEEKYGRYLLGDCPLCNSFTVIRFNRTSGIPFVGCASWNTYRGCQYRRVLSVTEHSALVATLEKERELFMWAAGREVTR